MYGAAGYVQEAHKVFWCQENRMQDAVCGLVRRRATVSKAVLVLACGRNSIEVWREAAVGDPPRVRAEAGCPVKERGQFLTRKAYLLSSEPELGADASCHESPTTGIATAASTNHFSSADTHTFRSTKIYERFRIKSSFRYVP